MIITHVLNIATVSQNIPILDAILLQLNRFRVVCFNITGEHEGHTPCFVYN